MYDIIGDIHGCWDEYVALTKALGYVWKEGIPQHPQQRTLVFLGDITDRGPDSVAMLTHVTTIVLSKKALYVPGNHCNKLYRYFLGRNVQLIHGLETTVKELQQLPAQALRKLKKAFIQLYESSALYLQLDQEQLVIAHAGISASLIGKQGKKVQTFVLYGDITGQTTTEGLPIRRDWAVSYTEDALIVYGHTPVIQPRKVNRTINIDTGCVFGNCLTALRYPEETTVSVPSSLPFSQEKFQTFN
ncbi:bis(5'-nucleosyl)-tetraphosphatase PrpE [Fictibacillus macauensis ZFHKF-1]|uniref:Bis(5'-nucleosyl)-tetraphosphatase PrpE n=1 Tax=Fictibacillus macauensis ZFHKF-1 TaxID=1196324 RepID=I8IYQ9_9BACL|nr:bis(5'-nucleosyl)-tetraphosphatase PrpE [Fictibacillus macauensis]EIT84611.1 bis(5'-nucleosyl)-tetraphosphatase PrpE [Fictibacillus macauensis ZFHKF-1]